MKKIAIILFVLLLAACTDPSVARRVLESNGYTQIEITGYNMFDCSKDDFYHTGFRAKAPGGKVVSGTVCSGLFFKGNTIRFD
jgi:hypothetical protein